MKKFEKMLGFELRGTIYGSIYHHPFVGLRRCDGVYTANAIFYGIEFEQVIGRRWFRRDIKKYTVAALNGLNSTIDRVNSDKEYKESVRLERPF